MTTSIAVLTTGSEILDGRVVDTNSNYVAQKLSELGLKLVRVLAVDDNLDELLGGLHYLHQVADVVITSGGLGPTEDDLTRDMSSRYVGAKLVEFPEARAHLEQFYAARKRVLDPSNLRQALLPEGSQMIHNPNGTAPGFIVTRSDGKIVCSLSGVPREFKRMFDETVLPIIVERAGKTDVIHRAGARLFGLPESVVGKEVVQLGLPKSVDVSYRAAFPEVHLVFKGLDKEKVDIAASMLRSSPTLSPYIFTNSIDQTFPHYISAQLADRNETIALAESCTGGYLGSAITALPGASQLLLGGVIAYSNEVKVRELKVPLELIEEHGAVSAPVAGAMACNVRAALGATYGISITGIAGPTGGSDLKPVGTFFVGVASASTTETKHCLFVNERTYVQRYAAYAALELLRRVMFGNLQKSPFPAEVVNP
jgi:nicotinamide-nucleotide amidase